MTLFQLSYALLWGLAILLVLASVVLLYLLANLKAQAGRAAGTSVGGHALVGHSIADLRCKEMHSGKPGLLGDHLGDRNVVICLSVSCGVCRGFLNDLLQRPSGGEVTFVALCMGELKYCKSLVSSVSSGSSRAGPVPLVVYDNNERREILTIGTPAALLVNKAGMVIDVLHPSSMEALIKTISTDISSAEAGLERRQLGRVA